MENFFKNRKEIEQFFKNEFFKFEFVSENTAYFKTIKPIRLDEDYFDFQLSFYLETNSTFFNYCSFTEWFDNLQLSQVTKIDVVDNSRETLYFKQYESA